MSATSSPKSVFTIQAREFAKLIDSLLPIAGSDLTPALHGIRLSRRGDRITLTATDRFRAAMTSAPVEWSDDAPQDWSALLPVPLCKRLVAAWKAASSESWFRVTVSASVTVDGLGDIEFVLRDGLGVTVGDKAAVRDDFPDVEKIANAVDAVDGEPSDMVSGFNFDYMLAFAKLRRHSREQVKITWPKTPARPIRIDIGLHTVGILMPIRVEKSYTVDEILGGAA